MRHVLPLFACVVLPAALSAQSPAVPFVGCRSDGQLGPRAAPHGHIPQLPLAREAAARLAWYRADGAPGGLAPRGWDCFSTYGSSGATLCVSPEPLPATRVLSSAWTGFSGAAIEMASSDGGTSGRFEVARLIARFFAAYRDFTLQVIADRTAADFPGSPYPNDKLTYRSKTLADFETPANAKGLGTDSRLQPSAQPITGFVFLPMEPNDDPDATSLAIRLSPSLATLAPAIRAGTGQALER